LYLGADGICGKKTWAALLSSRGDTTRKANALDTSTGIQQERAVALYNDGYRDVGRYLCNTIGSSFNKTMSFDELDRLKNAGLNVFPIYQTNGTQTSYFTAYRGATDAARAITYAKLFGFPQSATIYFAIDYDVLMADIEKNIIPYFTSIKHAIGITYKIGAYGPRYVCSKLSDLGLITSSFVSNMSAGFTCNIGQRMPENWAYDQYIEVSASKSEYGIGYDKIIASSRKTATTPTEFVESEVAAEKSFLAVQALYEHAYNYLISLYGINSAEPLVYKANMHVINYLRHQNYNGLKWDIIAGIADPGYLAYLDAHHEDESINIDPINITLPDYVTGTEIEVSHFAATLGSLNTIMVDFNLSPDRYVDGFAGWVGDMMQVGGIIGGSIALDGINYFTQPEDLKKCIGTMSGEADSLKFKFIEDEVVKENSITGFDYVDLVQDLDAYNITKIYNFYTTPFHEILNDYYISSLKCKRRYSIFEEYITGEYDKDTVYDVALMFATLDAFMLETINSFFQSMFGTFNNKLYGPALADAFAKRIEYYKAHE
jgi:peptidoglycan hydrolase-like protein with peptidoglycan-binding domain